jgi:excisionase family DNA binding protein
VTPSPTQITRPRRVVARQTAGLAFPLDATGEPPSLDAPLLTPDQAALLLAVKPSWVYDAVRARRLPCLRIGRHIRFTRSMLEAWLSHQRDEP